MRIDTAQITNWIVGKKTKGLKAKHLTSLLVDDSVLSKFLLTTLEGNQTLGRNNVVCVGESNDAWQQTSEALFKKYSVTGLDDEGWMVCIPKPENEVDYFETSTTDGDFYIIGQWGKDTPEGPAQYGTGGDYICRQRHDHSDVWIVKRQLFLNTYTDVEAQEHLLRVVK